MEYYVLKNELCFLEIVLNVTILSSIELCYSSKAAITKKNTDRITYKRKISFSQVWRLTVCDDGVREVSFF